MTTANSTAAADVLGTIGTVLWCIQLVPQIIHNWRRKNTEGLPPLMMLLWALSGVPFAIYFIVKQANIPVQVQPNVFMSLSLVCFAQCLYYPPNKLSTVKLVSYIGITVAFSAVVEAVCIVEFERLYKKGVTGPTTAAGVVASVLLALGLLPPYFELWKRGGRVIGINFIFLSIDSSGAIFSILSLVTQKGSVDILGCVLYAIILVMEGGIATSHIIWMLRTRKSRKLEKQRAAESDTAEADAEAVYDHSDEIEAQPEAVETAVVEKPAVEKSAVEPAEAKPSQA